MPSSKLPPAALERAFPAHPRPDRYFGSEVTESARRRLLQCVLRGDGPAMLVGAPGVGKTMLLEVLATELGGSLRVVRLASGQICTRRALLQAILHALDAPYRNRDEGELRLSLADLLENSPEPIALLIDEAQTLPLRLLEELRSLTNLVAFGVPAVRLVLAGTHALDETFTAPELEAFSQRLAARCYLEPLRREEVAQYVRAHVAAVGADPDETLADDVYEALARASDGLPRLINQVADRALVLSTESGAAALTAEAVAEAWSDMHQLAAPWQSPAGASLAAAATPDSEPAEIEFGSLDDDDHDALQAEAEAVTALASDLGVDHGVWDAGDKLRELGTVSAEPEADDADDELVAYQLPIVTAGSQAEACDLAVEEEPELEPIVEAEAEPEPKSEPDSKPAPERAFAADPFAEDFDEEELVLDPHAELERVIPAAPTVELNEPNDVSRAYQEVTAPRPEADAPLLVAAGSIEEPSLVVEEAPGESADADDLLIVEEEDEAPIDGGAVRREYSALFAGLRQG